MIIGTKELENSRNLVRVSNGLGFDEVEFYKLKYIKTAIVQGVTTTIPNTGPDLADVLTANDSLDSDVQAYCTDNFPYQDDWATTTRYICYESNRDLMNAAGASVTYVHAQVDVYEIVKSTGNAY
jgi:hypothetical protein